MPPPYLSYGGGFFNLLLVVSINRNNIFLQNISYRKLLSEYKCVILLLT